MVYRLVTNHQGVTLKDIAEAEGIDNSSDFGFYQLTRREKVSATKILVLWSSDQVVSNNTADVLTRCGLRPNSFIEPKDIPANHLLFVQSSSPYRKLPADAAALFIVNEGKKDDGIVSQLKPKVTIPIPVLGKERYKGPFNFTGLPSQSISVAEAKVNDENDEEEEESAPRKRKNAKAAPKKSSKPSASAVKEGGGKHTYKVVNDHEDGATLKEIAAEAGINHLLAFYELTKKEKVSAGKKLALMKDGKLVSDDSAEVLKRCGLSAGKDNNIEPKHVPKGHQLFVQSTSTNRKMSEDVAAAFYVLSADDDEEQEDDENEEDHHDNKDEKEKEGDDDRDEDDDESDGDDDGEPSKKKLKGSDIEWAISFENEVIEELLNAEDEPDEVDNEELYASFKHPIGTLFNDCDALVPAEAQTAALTNLSLLFTADWDKETISIQTKVNPYTQKTCIKRASAVGTVKHYCVGQRNGFNFPNFTTEPVRIEYSGVGPTFMCSFGKRWSAMIGSDGAHPFVYCNEICYENSDGSSRQGDLIDLPRGTSKVDRLNAIIAFNIKWFIVHCGNYEH